MRSRLPDAFNFEINERSFLRYGAFLRLTFAVGFKHHCSRVPRHATTARIGWHAVRFGWRDNERATDFPFVRMKLSISAWSGPISATLLMVVIGRVAVADLFIEGNHSRFWAANWNADWAKAKVRDAGETPTCPGNRGA